ncbi:hypothetical protein [Streptomyces caniscabiei]|uniref:Uncharacterized protein n=1 Tax=Streptomyces caniscabiei TaxID=2746961 RepID=A0A927LA29_9ACTN|nr:hypothetical protein [Streptomyces caniscabiei]MBD9726864.1 hypothetical protein [Streptomyces caniscabiei]MDX3513737.1 hypothetical protein [Streptomyces caniscabiei]MDX3722572.1 hypothetical protein [Streptomyces caniscabiei]WEO23285.1 hypothetical protein IHE65_09000 [Streptomyces caniscabiei]
MTSANLPLGPEPGLFEETRREVVDPFGADEVRLEVLALEAAAGVAAGSTDRTLVNGRVVR